jgi:hypothetical protein
MKPAGKILPHMSVIINNLDKNFSPAEQQVIRNAMANYGVDKVFTSKNATDGGNDTLFDFYDENDNYLFSIDTDADGDCVIWNKA